MWGCGLARVRRVSGTRGITLGIRTIWLVQSHDDWGNGYWSSIKCDELQELDGDRLFSEERLGSMELVVVSSVVWTAFYWLWHRLKYRLLGRVLVAVVYRGGGGGVKKHPHPEIPNFWQSWSEFQFRGKYICNNLIRIRVSLICKLSGTPG
jgi:hypothetical protein